MTTPAATAEDTQATTGAEIVQVARATWKQHGNPTGGFLFYGTAVKEPAAEGVKVAKVEVGKQGITLKAANGRAVKGGAFGTATKFWAHVPADAEHAAAPEGAKAKAEPKAKPAPKDKAAPTAKAEPKIPAGYMLRWPHGGYDLYKKTDAAAEDGAAWYTVCNLHGDALVVGSAKEGDIKSTRAARPEWCKGCATDAKAAK
jgi:hypothetical protein